MTNPVTQTAVGPMTIIATEQYYPEGQRLVDDLLAFQFLSPGIQFIVKLTRWPFFRNLLFNVSEKSGPGIYGSMLGRKRYIDEKTTEAISAGIKAIVILGAGLDTRAYRLAVPANIPAYEVDLPENIAYKKDRLMQVYGKVPAPVTLIPLDFESQDLETTLLSSGYSIGQKSLFIWEAVTQYLTEASIRKTFEFLAKAATGSRLLFTYVLKDFIEGKNLYGSEALYQRFRVKEQLWRFGLAPQEVAGFLADYGWRELEQMGSQEFATRYLKPYGRPWAASEIERVVQAEKL